MKWNRKIEAEKKFLRRLLLALEFGYKECERGNNLERAKENYLDVEKKG